MYELIVIWSTGEKDVTAYPTREDAEQAGRNMKMVFGNQIEWTGVRHDKRSTEKSYSQI